MLFYLANDVLQNGRRRGADLFLEVFKDPLRQAAIMIRCVSSYVCVCMHITIPTFSFLFNSVVRRFRPPLRGCSGFGKTGRSTIVSFYESLKP